LYYLINTKEIRESDFMDVIEIYVDGEDNERIDTYLAEAIDEISRSYIQKLIKEKLVKVNGKDVKSKYLVSEGDHIVINVPEPKKLEITPENIPIDIIYEDEDVAVVYKPQGMVVHPAPGNYSGTLVNALLYHLDSLSSINGVIRPGIVHRIDKDTSGLLMVAKSNLAHIELSKQLKEHTIKRVYYTLVDENIREEKGRIATLIGRHPVDRKRMTVVDYGGREAITHFTVLERFIEYTLLEVQLETGRTHQIRVHLAHIGHPIIGDEQYGSRTQAKRVLLHSSKIKILDYEFNAREPKEIAKYK